MLQQNEDFLTQIWSLIILKDNYRSATNFFISSHQYSTYKCRWCHHWRTNFKMRNFFFRWVYKRRIFVLSLWTRTSKIYDVVLSLKIFFLGQLLSVRKQKVETKVDVVWIIIISIFIIIYYSYVIICSVPSVNA